MAAKQSHGKLADHHFFAVFQPGFNSETLKIPPGFLKEGVNQVIVSSNYCRKGEGEGEGEDCWGTVEIYRFSKDQVYLHYGWEKFVENHHLHEGDFLLFKYDGGMRFSVRIFEEDGLEKAVYYSSNTTINIEAKTTSSKRPMNYDHQRQSAKENTSDHHSSPGRRNTGRNRKDYDIVQEKTKSFTSRNPFFWRLLKDYNVNTNYILSTPKSMAKNIFTEDTEEVTLKNKEGRSWEVMVRTSNGQYYFVPSGWKSFVVDNSLKAGDVCIFELVGDAVLQLHVF